VTRFAELDAHPRYDVASSQTVETIISVNGEKRLKFSRSALFASTANGEKA
jgi:hypothetical protein